MKNPWVIVGVVAVVLFGGAIWYSGNATEANNAGVVVEDKIKGNPVAEVTLVEYADFQCPACASFQPVLAEVFDTYGDRMQFEFKHFPLPIHPFAQQAAVAAEAAGQQGKFYEFHDVLFANQQEWSGSAIPTVLFARYAEELGLDVELFRRHQNSTLLRDAVRADLADARELGLTGTPTFFLNGERMQFQTFEEFVNQIAIAVDPEAAAALQTTATSEELVPEIQFGI